MMRPKKALLDMRVVISDSEPDLDDDSDRSNDDAKATKRTRIHLSASTKPGTGDGSDNSGDDDLHGASGKSDEETPSATSEMRDPSYRNATTRLENDTSGEIGELMKVNRKSNTGGIDVDNIISPLSQASSKYYSPQNGQEHPGKRQTRGHGRKPVSYDMKHHPMDDILRPKYSAKRRGIVKQVPEESCDSDGEIDEDDENDAPSGRVSAPVPHRRRSSRKIHQSERPIYSAEWHPLDQMLKENSSSMRVWNRGECSIENHKSTESSSTLKDEEISITVQSDFDLDGDADKASISEGRAAPINSNQRRSARVSSSKDAPPNYDMKYHVMDSTLRPKAAAKRMKSKLPPAILSQTLSKLASSAENHIKQLTKSSPKSLIRRQVHQKSELEGPNVSVIPAWSELQNPYLNRMSLDWAEIQEMDRCIYLLQKGAPLYDNTLPQDWNSDIVKKILSDKGIEMLDELSIQDSIETLKLRYESVRLGLQTSFASTPEPVTKNGWKLFKAEDFDVYNKTLGLKYWRHQRDSVVEGSKTSSSFNIMGSTNEIARHLVEDHNEEATGAISEKQDRKEGKMPKSMQNVMDEMKRLNKSYLKSPPGLEVDAERTTNIDREDDGEKSVVTVTEDTLIESMRGEHVPFPVMSVGALEELLSTAEQYLAEEINHEIKANLISSNSRAFQPAGAILDKTLDEGSSVASEARVLDLNASSNRGLDEPTQIGKGESRPEFSVSPYGRYDEPRTPKMEVKARKRKSRTDFTIAIHEDLPGRTPLIKKIVRMNPASPGTDIPTENLEDDGSIEHSSRVEIGIPRTHQAISTPSTGRVRSLGNATDATPPYRSLFGGPLGPLSSESSRTIS